MCFLKNNRTYTKEVQADSMSIINRLTDKLWFTSSANSGYSLTAKCRGSAL